MNNFNNTKVGMSQNAAVALSTIVVAVLQPIEYQHSTESIVEDALRAFRKICMHQSSPAKSGIR